MFPRTQVWFFRSVVHNQLHKKYMHSTDFIFALFLWEAQRSDSLFTFQLRDAALSSDVHLTNLTVPPFCSTLLNSQHRRNWSNVHLSGSIAFHPIELRNPKLLSLNTDCAGLPKKGRYVWRNYVKGVEALLRCWTFDSKAQLSLQTCLRTKVT